MERFRFLEKIAVADVAFEAFGRSLEELFESSALALFSAMVELESVEAKASEKVELESETAPDLLFDWLSELVYLKDLKAAVYKDFSVSIDQGERFKLVGIAKGEPIDAQRHKLKVDVKAVTYHLLEVRKKNGLWRAQVILDI
ncbi:MAG: archease [candidate division Zixibacteria bacterium]|nr:archease [candidate division Zixibacteria bacterium]